ncbi:GIY-YIG nuclease family protein [Thalassobellus suaedae]|uniref:GIY-YIG nuclease family protein n=1 Tax=Thalassobellus suaedae TaxID=3074124 RepID=A0ABY9XPF9_9FLAO|nr:GIY-YIG nuclease family protein [Flavobacteriaceae bacterium HL-DH14]
MDVHYVYILTNNNHTVLYVGRTKQLKTRLVQHKNNNLKTFTGKYNVDKLVYFETTKYVNNSIKRERQIKKWNREWKINLINGLNPDWKNLSEYIYNKKDKKFPHSRE